MDFSAWDWSDTFRLQDAACLIAGVMPVSKRNPTSEEMPPQARPIFIKLTTAYIEWLLQGQNPERPKSQVLEGYKEEDGSFPPFPGLKTIGTEIIPRKSIHRFLSETGRKSVYDFQPIPAAIGTTVPAPMVQAWEPMAVNRAIEIIERDRKKSLFPSQIDIADEIAREFRAAGVVGAGGKPLTGAYIKRHALKGISSEQGKQLSTATSRGK